VGGPVREKVGPSMVEEEEHAGRRKKKVRGKK
jgi:hypothetical protein